MNDNDLNKEFRALAHSYPRQASERVEQKLIAEFRRRRRRRVWPPAVALAAGLAIIFGLAQWQKKKSTSFIGHAPEVTTATQAIVTPEMARVPAGPAVMKPVVHHK